MLVLPCRRCDLANCNTLTGSVKILQRCGHSFHLSCFPSGVSTCIICKEELVKAMKTLSAKASESICNPQSSKQSEEEEIEEEEDEEDLTAKANEAERNESIISDSLLKIQQEICSWCLIPGP